MHTYISENRGENCSFFNLCKLCIFPLLTLLFFTFLICCFGGFEKTIAKKIICVAILSRSNHRLTRLKERADNKWLKTKYMKRVKRKMTKKKQWQGFEKSLKKITLNKWPAKMLRVFKEKVTQNKTTTKISKIWNFETTKMLGFGIAPTTCAKQREDRSFLE